MSLPRYEISLLVLLAAVMLIGLVTHLSYIRRVSNEVRRTSDRSFQEKEMKIALLIPQGSNFNTVMIFSWNLFIVAVAFLYFLTPEIFPGWNYFRQPHVASLGIGLAIFGAALILIPGFFISIHVPRVYGNYLISNWLKELNLLTPILLLVSIFCSVNLGTIYPRIDSFFWIAGYASLFAAMLLMLMPMILGFAEEIR
jgi:hypothetical protein